MNELLGADVVYSSRVTPLRNNDIDDDKGYCIITPINVAVICNVLLCQRGTFDGRDHSINGKLFLTPTTTTSR